MLSPYPVPGAALHSHFSLISSVQINAFPICNSEMSMALCKLKTTLSIEFLEERSPSCYLTMVAKVVEGTFELDDANVKLAVLNNGHDR